MKPQVRATRALAAYSATRSLRLATNNLLIVFTLVVTAIGLLAYKFSSAWLLLLIVVGIVFIVYLLIWAAVRRLIRIVYPEPLSQAQRKALYELTQKVLALAESRNTPAPLLAMVTIKDLLVHRDTKTINNLVSNSKSLVNDFSKLKDLFKDR